jgi:hypothetical protein
MQIFVFGFVFNSYLLSFLFKGLCLNVNADKECHFLVLAVNNEPRALMLGHAV